ncbi:ABC transporter ATP-binding protein [Paracoccus sp. TOH]|uniref:ABC transporter ATP-binding protein n=1 Tax=Paracoccus sp. TOH TaxID=1263728 RepID=UPI0025B1B4C1|nr:ABC transporter ATP-binding protein [Paracoccus sp. TOH]WJS85405.1 ABC transporter ATP-binding protein [Paracoccus sp. TOH]
MEPQPLGSTIKGITTGHRFGRYPGVSGEVMVDTAVFRLEGVTKRYGDLVALDNATLEAGANEYISLLGPSGSGKTTLLRVIAGFEAPEAGRVYFEGRDITHVPAHERGIGFVFQNFALFPHLTVIQNVAFGLTHGKSGLSPSEIERRSLEMIDLVGLSGMEGRGVDQISGGQRQRVALARTLTMHPRLVLLDEPLGALDANLRGRMRNELRAIRERLGVTFLHVTGSETEALAMGDRVVVLNRGRIIQTGKPNDVYDRPASPDVAHFLNRFNLFDGRLSGGVFSGVFGVAPAGQAVHADRDIYAVRYDRINVLPVGAGADGPGIRAKFLTSEYLGSSIVNFFETADGEVIEMEHHLSLGAPQTFEIRQDYLLTWNPEQAIAFGREARS